MDDENGWRDRPTCSWKNSHSWEAWLRITCTPGVLDCCVEFVEEHGKRATKENAYGLRRELSAWLEGLEPDLDQDKVDWIGVYKAVSEYA